MRWNAWALVAVTLTLSLVGCADTSPAEAPTETEKDWGFDEGDEDTPPPDDEETTSESPRLDTPGEPVIPITHSAEVTGAWVQDTIGNCIALEDWLVLSADGNLERVLVDRNACGEPTLARQVGQWSADGAQLRMRWSDQSRTTVRSATTLEFDDDDQHAMNLMGYVSEDATTFRRVDETITTGDRNSSNRVEVDVTFTDGLDTSAGSPCQMQIELRASADGEEATEQFEFDCVVEDADARRAVYAEGMWRSGASDAWLELFEERGIWERYPARLSNLMYDAFRPVFFVEPDRPNRLWHEVPRAWYRFTDQSPPASTAELGD